MEWTIVAAILGSVGIISGAVLKIVLSRSHPDTSWKDPLETTQNSLAAYKDEMNQRFDTFKIHAYETFQNHHDRLVHLEADFTQALDKIDEIKASIEKLDAKIQALTEKLISRS